MSCDVLVITAHPDDEIFVSGVICACVDKGLVVKIVCVTDGEGGGLERVGAASPEALAQIRRQELQASARVLGVTEVFLLSRPDIADPAGAGGWDLAALVSDLGGLIDKEAPRAILTHGPLGGYGNTAHKMVHKCVMRAVENLGANVAVLSFCGKTPKAFFSWHFDQPSDLLFDVRHFIQRRCDSLSQHFSQLDYFTQPEMPKNIRKLLSAIFGYTFSMFEYGRKRVPIITPRRFFERFPFEGLVRQKVLADGEPDLFTEMFLHEDRAQPRQEGRFRRGRTQGSDVRPVQQPQSLVQNG